MGVVARLHRRRDGLPFDKNSCSALLGCFGVLSFSGRRYKSVARFSQAVNSAIGTGHVSLWHMFSFRRNLPIGGGFVLKKATTASLMTTSLRFRRMRRVSFLGHPCSPVYTDNTLESTTLRDGLTTPHHSRIAGFNPSLCHCGVERHVLGCGLAESRSESDVADVLP